MAFPDLAVNADYPALCLVPGFRSLKTALSIANVDMDMTQFEKSTWSFIASGVALSASYFLYVIWVGIVTGRFLLIRSLDITWVEGVAIYPLFLCVAIIVSQVSAKIYLWTLGTPTPLQPETTSYRESVPCALHARLDTNWKMNFHADERRPCIYHVAREIGKNTGTNIDGRMVSRISPSLI